MQNLQTPIISLVVFSFLTHIRCMNAKTDMGTGSVMLDNCQTQVCSYDDPITRYVRFPFRIRNDSLPRSCGYPGFDLVCDGTGRLLVDLPSSGKFSVRSIDYIKQEISVNDPNNCLPKRLLSIDQSTLFDGSPFTPATQFRKSYWLYNCSMTYFESLNVKIKPIRCLSGTTYGVIASPFKVTGLTANTMGRMCKYVGSIRIPAGSLDLSEDIRLSWVEPGCSQCYMKKGRCGFKSYRGLEIDCFDIPRHGLRRQTIVAIALAFAAPLAFFTCCTTYLALQAFCLRRRRTRNNATITALTAQPHQSTINGLDRATIESYPRVVLGESRRLPKPDDKSCPICLGEYLAKEALRTLPQCGHCFHADCIDEWLELNASCPVCRNTPSSSTPDVT